MSFDEFKDVNLNCFKLGMAWCVEMLTKGLRSIRFGNVTEMFHKAFFSVLAWSDPHPVCYSACISDSR